ncbi:hypothetical protein EV715DRAFT_297049 [Schizophyllum commune]
MPGVPTSLPAWLHGKQSVNKTKLLTVLEANKARDEEERRKGRAPFLWASTPPSPPYASFPPAQFVLDKLRKREHFDLWFVTPEGCRETDNLNRSDSDVFTLAKDDGGKLTFPSTPSYRRSGKARADDQLTMVDTSLV